jgi:hypothetical protein
VSRPSVSAVTLDGRVIVSLARTAAEHVSLVKERLDAVLCAGVGYAHVTVLDLVVVSTNGAQDALGQIVAQLAVHESDVRVGVES